MAILTITSVILDKFKSEFHTQKGFLNQLLLSQDSICSKSINSVHRILIKQHVEIKAKPKFLTSFSISFILFHLIQTQVFCSEHDWKPDETADRTQCLKSQEIISRIYFAISRNWAWIKKKIEDLQAKIK